MTRPPPRPHPQGSAKLAAAPARAQIRLSAQVLTCLVFCLLAAPIMYFTRGVTQRAPLALFDRPLAPLSQLLIGQGLALIAAAGSYLAFRFTAGAESTARTVASYARLDLGGLNPLWIALCAAIGEEILFRAALQPLLGVWIVSLVFLATHVPVYRLRRLDRPALAQAGGVFGVSVALGFVFQYVGLLAAMLVHLWIDIVGLLVLRNVIRMRG